MTSLRKNIGRETFVLIGLLAITMTTCTLKFGTGLHNGNLFAVAVYALLAVKLFLIANFFMEIGASPPLLRVIFNLWIVGVIGTLIGLTVRF